MGGSRHPRAQPTQIIMVMVMMVMLMFLVAMLMMITTIGVGGSIPTPGHCPPAEPQLASLYRGNICDNMLSINKYSYKYKLKYSYKYKYTYS